jgi:molecular chaperone DnaK (HSP70)
MWAIDFGTTNTGIARWDHNQQRAEMFEIPELCRDIDGTDELGAPRMVPSAVHMLPADDLWGTLGKWSFFAKRTFWGQQALIGRPALERNQARISHAFAAQFKRDLGSASLKLVARVDDKRYSVRDVTRTYLRELFAAIHRKSGERIRELAVTVPVDAYESYRAELRTILQAVGVHKVHFVDEPVAAAAGYGVSAGTSKRALVVDFGAGTLDFALVDIDAKGMQAGKCEVLAKVGRALGGSDVDEWLYTAFCDKLGYRIPDTVDDFWRRWMIDEARSIKEQLFTRPKTSFLMRPPDDMRAVHSRIHGDDPYMEYSRDDLVALLKTNGLYQVLDECLAEILEQAEKRGVLARDIDEVLMVGGSTLLPNVYTLFENKFGRDRVRAWHPFEAVVRGACSLLATGISHVDFIVHDYAFVTHDKATNTPQYQVIIPKGTYFPTADKFWRRQLIPTCPLGEPETIFRLVVCEVGHSGDNDRAFGWDKSGNLHKLDSDNKRLIVPLNESSPTLGTLNPPHKPSDRAPRLDVSFGVNENRWLCATVSDLKTNKVLLDNEPIIRLL